MSNTVSIEFSLELKEGETFLVEDFQKYGLNQQIWEKKNAFMNYKDRKEWFLDVLDFLVNIETCVVNCKEKKGLILKHVNLRPTVAEGLKEYIEMLEFYKEASSVRKENIGITLEELSEILKTGRAPKSLREDVALFIDGCKKMGYAMPEYKPEWDNYVFKSQTRSEKDETEGFIQSEEQ